MPTTRAQRIRDLFDQAIELPPTERRHYLKVACEGNLDLFREVAELVRLTEGEPTPLDIDPTQWFQEIASSTARQSLDPLRDGPSGDAQHALAGTVIGDFRIVRLLGRGGMSTVYEAEQLSVPRLVALKVLEAWSVRQDVRRRFTDEAGTLAQLKHPGIANVIAAGSHDLGLLGDRGGLVEHVLGDATILPWIAIELVEHARTIVEASRDRAEGEVLALFALVADAVQHGHQQGFIHRDLKPANILVDARGVPKVIDFGIARMIAAPKSAAATQGDELLGSPRYMSPEQVDSRVGPVDTRSDVYALGVVLYEALTGKTPHTTLDESIAAVARAICEQTPADPRSLRPGLTRDASLVVLKAISRDPDGRYQSAAELAADLRRVIAREPIVARPPSATYAAFMLVRRRPFSSSMAVAAVVGLLAGLVGISLGLTRERAARHEADRTARLANLNAADAAIRLGDGGTAVRRLVAIRPDHRGWEWRYLRGRADSSTQFWDVPGAPDGTVVSPSGRYLISGWFEDGVMQVFDSNTRQRQAEWHLGTCTGIQEWNSDESLVALPMLDSVTVVEMETGRVLKRLSMDGGAVPLACAFSPDSRLLAVGRASPAGLEVYDLSTGARVFNSTSDGWVYRPAFTPDGRRLIWCDLSVLNIADTVTWQVAEPITLQRATRFEPSPVIVSPDGQTAAVVCGTFVQLVDLPGRSIRAELRDHAQRIHSIRFDSAGRRLVTTSMDRTVRVWSAATGKGLSALLGHERPSSSAAFDHTSDDELDRVISVDMGSRVRWWDARSLTPVLRGELPRGAEYVRQLCFGEDNSQLRAAARVSIATLDLRRPAAPGVERPIDAAHVCLVPGQDLIICNSDSTHFALESPSNGSVLWTMESDPAIAMVVNSQGSVFAIHHIKDRMSLYRVRDGSLIGTLHSPGSTDHLATISPDGSELLVPSFAGRVRLFDVQSCTLIAELAGPGKRGQGTGFSPDGSLLAFCHAEEGVTVTDARTLKPLVRIDSIGGSVWSLAISPDNTRIAVGAQDRITHIFEVPTGDELLQLRDHTGTVMSIAWSPDGRYLATGGYDKQIFVYDSTPPGSDMTEGALRPHR